MGCCKSTPVTTITSLTNLSQLELAKYQEIIQSVPLKYRQSLRNMPADQLLTGYKYHEIARQNFKIFLYPLALINDRKALTMFLKYLPDNHYIIVNILENMSWAYYELGANNAAKEVIIIVIQILKDNGDDDENNKKIASQYFQLGKIYQLAKNYDMAILSKKEALKFGRSIFTQETVHEIEEQIEKLTELAHGNFMRIMYEQLIEMNAQNGTLQFDKNEFKRKADKQTETLVDDQILKDVYDAFEHWLRKYLTFNGDGYINFIAAQFKNTNMKQSMLTPAVIEAALTIIIDHLQDYPKLIELNKKYQISYTDESKNYSVGIRVFQAESKTTKA
ncbi:unnamed protein product [Didymodactylos carnosus]|uniref:Uncharacterized protein n=1 Tax=Didymodactylos carnosus TaxID=1234261 RepID=A0A814U347_9BILA|nr:unnamed protein product [Didymodactylos carnosus]CAF1170272.1 unnamed protein product [Didymodactylos carnosus]CAF3705665.1 unnamed protein product [Didymodactylos carnosus]CAF3934014.1 unnamed protein product [Didymodactylos carnosus]